MEANPGEGKRADVGEREPEAPSEDGRRWLRWGRFSGRRKLVVWAVLGAGLLIGGYLLWSALAVTTSEYVVLERETALETVLATGAVTGKENTPLAFSRPGPLERVQVEEGDRVTRDQVLAVQDNSQDRVRVAQEEKLLGQARSQVRTLQTTDLAQAREELTQAEARQRAARTNYEHVRRDAEIRGREGLRQARIEAEDAETRFNRRQELYAEGLISRAELEEAEKNWRLAESALTLAQSDYEGRRATQEQARSDLAVATSNVAGARAIVESLTGEGLERARLEQERAGERLEEARLQYDETYLRAPFAGEVTRLRASPGEFRQAGEEVLVLVPEAGTTFVRVEVDENLVGRVRPGQEALVTTSAFPEEQYDARVSRVAPAVDSDRGTFTVRLELDRKAEELVPDLAAFAEIIIERQEDCLVLEERLVYREDGRKYVNGVRRGRVERLPVEGRDLGGGYVLIEEGLEAGERILTALDLSPGQRVRAVPGGE